MVVFIMVVFKTSKISFGIVLFIKLPTENVRSPIFHSVNFESLNSNMLTINI